MNIDKLLHDFLSKGVEFYPATNSLKFHSSDDNNKNYLWIEPPWRIRKGNRVIASSFSCPWHENFDTKEEYSAAFANWCETMKHLNELEIKRCILGQPVNDLVIEWTDGTVLEVFQVVQHEDNWYITSISERKYYRALPDKIETEEMD